MAISFRGSVATYVQFGNNDTLQNLFVIENAYGSRVDVYIRRLLVQCDNVGLLTSVMPLVRTSRTASFSGGESINKNTFDSSMSSDRYVRLWGSRMETAPISATAGQTAWEQYTNRLHTAAEQKLSFDNNMLPLLVANSGSEFILHSGEALLVQVVSPTEASNYAVSNNWFVECVWEENALSTFAISGMVTLSGSGIDGAKVIVIESTDRSMTNAVLHEVLTTSSGAWASTIVSGRVGSVFVQYENGGALYTAPGSPFLEAS